METKRLFIAIPLSQEIQTNLHNHLAPLRQTNKSVKWINADQAHFTLAFLGDVEQAKRASIERACQETVNKHYAFSIHLNEPGVFPNENHPRILWIGLDKGSEEMKCLAQTLQEQLSVAGLVLEKRLFVPHLTIGRVRSHKKIKTWFDIKHTLREITGDMDVSTLSLIQSTLASSGPVYKNLVTFSLQHV